MLSIIVTLAWRQLNGCFFHQSANFMQMEEQGDMLNITSTFRLNNNVEMPAFGFGVFQAAPEDTVTAVTEAINGGYRLIDTASVYNNEREVGQAVAQGEANRSDLFITTKLWISEYGYDEALYGFDRSLRKLGLDYLDLYLLHWPVPSDFEKTVQSYKAAERLLAEGRVRAIGVSNFSSDHIDRLMEQTSIVPAVNQIELHPYFSQTIMRQAHAQRSIVTQAWSPLGAVNIYEADAEHPARYLLQDGAIQALARRYGKSPAQIVLRWHLQHGISVIPKSTRPARIAENAALFDFELSTGDMLEIDRLDTDIRGGYAPEEGDRTLFPAVIED